MIKLLKSGLFYLLFVSVILSGCGYTTRSTISNEFKTIYITPFVNKIDITSEEYTGNKYKVYRPLLETEITKAVQNRYLLDGNLKPVNKENADLVLQGDLVDFRRDPLRYTDSDDVAEYRLNLVVNIALKDVKKEKVLWEENNFTGQYTYFPTGSQATPESKAINSAVEDLARRVVERTVEQW